MSNKNNDGQDKNTNNKVTYPSKEETFCGVDKPPVEYHAPTDESE